MTSYTRCFLNIQVCSSTQVRDFWFSAVSNSISIIPSIQLNNKIKMAGYTSREVSKNLFWLDLYVEITTHANIATV